jgi:hypothetical protein
MEEGQQQPYQKADLYFGASSNKKIIRETLLADVLRLCFIERRTPRDIADILSASHMALFRAISDPDVEVLL